MTARRIRWKVCGEFERTHGMGLGASRDHADSGIFKILWAGEFRETEKSGVEVDGSDPLEKGLEPERAGDTFWQCIRDTLGCEEIAIGFGIHPGPDGLVDERDCMGVIRKSEPF